MDLGTTKCAITSSPNKSKLNPQAFKAFIQSHNITYRNQPIPVLHQNEKYLYLGIHLVPSLKWNIQIHETTSKLTLQCQLLAACPASLKHKIKMVDMVVRIGIAYSFYAIPYSMPTLAKLDKKIIALQKKICGLPCSTPNITTQLPHESFGLDAFSLKTAYLRCIGEQLRDVLNDPGYLGILYRGLTHYIMAKNGGSHHIPRITPGMCLRSSLTRTMYLLKQHVDIHIQSFDPKLSINPTSFEIH
jgi:hypothetical protein